LKREDMIARKKYREGRGWGGVWGWGLRKIRRGQATKKINMNARRQMHNLRVQLPDLANNEKKDDPSDNAVGERT
jgi:hypothetical protein